MKNKLWHISRDTNGKGEQLLDLLVELNLIDNQQVAKESLRKGEFTVNRQVIKDIRYILNKGSHVIAFSNQPQVRVTII